MSHLSVRERSIDLGSGSMAASGCDEEPLFIVIYRDCRTDLYATRCKRGAFELELRSPGQQLTRKAAVAVAQLFLAAWAPNCQVLWDTGIGSSPSETPRL